MPSKRCPPLSHKERADFYIQLAVLDNAGIATHEGWAMLTKDAPAKQAACLQAVQRRLQKGEPLSKAGRLAGLFTILESRLLAVAEHSGNHEAIYRKLASHYEHQAKRQQRIRSRLVMPGVIFVLALFIRPFPALILNRIDAFSYLSQTFGILFLFLIAFSMLRWLQQQLHAQQGSNGPQAQVWDRMLFALPMFGPMHIRRNANAFLDKLGLLLEAGVPMLEALPMAVEAINSPLIRKDFARIAPLIEGGMTFSNAVAELQYLGGNQALYFIQSGEASGSLEELILRHSRMETAAIDDFDDQLATWIPRLIYALLALWMAYSILKMGLPMPPDVLG